MSLYDTVKFHVRREAFLGDLIEINFASFPADGAPAFAQPVVFKVVPEDEWHLKHDPALVIGRDSAQNLMDELWNVGIRPTEGAGSAGAMAATVRHLEDMRTLVFKKE